MAEGWCIDTKDFLPGLQIFHIRGKLVHALQIMIPEAGKEVECQAPVSGVALNIKKCTKEELLPSDEVVRQLEAVKVSFCVLEASRGACLAVCA